MPRIFAQFDLLDETQRHAHAHLLNAQAGTNVAGLVELSRLAPFGPVPSGIDGKAAGRKGIDGRVVRAGSGRIGQQLLHGFRRIEKILIFRQHVVIAHVSLGCANLSHRQSGSAIDDLMIRGIKRSRGGCSSTLVHGLCRTQGSADRSRALRQHQIIFLSFNGVAQDLRQLGGGIGERFQLVELVD